MRGYWMIAAFGLLGVGSAVAFARGPEPATKPPSGDAPPAPPAVVEPEDPARRRVVESQELRDAADLKRAAFEKGRRAGPVADDAEEKRFDAVVAAYRAAIDRDPRGAVATYCRQRLAGAYTFVGNFDGGLRVLVEAVNAAAGPADQLEACHSAGFHCLQAMHKPDEALRWFRRAETLIGKIEEPEGRAKWAVAIAQGVARCEEEAGK